MDWRARLRELVLAGGTVALSAGVSGCIPGCAMCNANPDPCCSQPKSQACADWNACVASTDGGDVLACYYHPDLAAPDLAPAADLARPHDVGGGD